MSAGLRLAGLAAALRARWPRWRAEVEWAVGSWRRPAGAEANWEQNPDRSRRRPPVRERRAPHPRPGSRGS